MLYLEGKTLVQNYFFVEDDKARCMLSSVRPCTRMEGWRGRQLSKTVVDVIFERQWMVLDDLRSFVMLLMLFLACVGCFAC